MAVGDEYLQRIGAALAWTWPKEMTHADIKMVIQQFVDTARLMADAGFKGVELHSAHGYLLDQFLNAKTNLRTDEYGGSPERRARFVLEVLSEIRKVVPPTFCVGIKLNSADYSSATFEDTMTQIRLFVDAGVDFMEISGGSYEDPKMMGYPKDSEPKSSRTAAREAFFLEFAKEVRKRHPDLVLMLTGGFRTREGAESAIAENACDLVGIARPAAVNPSFANILLDKELPDEKAQLWLDKVRPPFYSWFLPRHISGGGAETTYYAGQINRLAKGLATYAP
ncbi:hypothetical protein Plec18167_006708 [Paecilomyces lecythidis]|uniref:NADH:flavin oxidoreductase/NADH oxidase N-terminal domain-containing protein n=1 Tax=Paecilomyces lecythidis TaxID=3004212 RepID=A0ABR3X9H8_9EURO